jgi:hypothetical protein
MAMNNTITYTGYDPASEHVFSVRGTGTTRALALSEANARLALTVMAFPVGRESQVLPVGDSGTAAGGVGKDATIVLTKGIGFTDKVIHLQECTVAVKLANSKGKIDITHPLITAFVLAYIDGDGVSGYSVVSGQFDE